MQQRTHIDEVLARQVAGDTLADIRTVRRVLRGERVRGVVAERIIAAISARRPSHPAIDQKTARWSEDHQD